MSLAGKSLRIRFGRRGKRVIKFYAFGTVASIGRLAWNHDVRAVVAQEPMSIGPCRHTLELLTFHAVWALDAFNYMHRSRPSRGNPVEILLSDWRRATAHATSPKKWTRNSIARCYLFGEPTVKNSAEGARLVHRISKLRVLNSSIFNRAVTMES